jgi:hypothetical protein
MDWGVDGWMTGALGCLDDGDGFWDFSGEFSFDSEAF